MNKKMQSLVDLKVKRGLLQSKLDSKIEEVRKAEDEDELEKASDDAEKIKEELKETEDEIARAEEELDEQEKQNEELDKEEEGRKLMNNSVYTRKVVVETPEERAQKVKACEERKKALIEGRSITVASSDVFLPTHDATELQTYPFKPVSSIADLVKTVPLKGGESYQKAFVKSYGVAGTTLEGADYAETEPTWDYAMISKVKITAYTEVTEEVLKLPALDYEAEVLKNINVSLKKKFAQQITLGAGTTNTFKGLFATGANAPEALDTANDDISISAIDENTLDDILFAYGGDEEVAQTPCVLILNKLDLKQFVTLRNQDKERVYDVDLKNQTIDGIPYVINSNCPALSASTTTASTLCMAYGPLDAYEVPIFSDVEIMKSTDYKFKQGIVCYKASVFAGGNVGTYRGFVRVKKA
jgi:HK97 family phage major capsid protein